MSRASATPEPFSVWTNFTLASVSRKRMLARRAWKSSKFETLEVSSYRSMPGDQISMS